VYNFLSKWSVGLFLSNLYACREHKRRTNNTGDEYPGANKVQIRHFCRLDKKYLTDQRNSRPASQTETGFTKQFHKFIRIFTSLVLSRIFLIATKIGELLGSYLEYPIKSVGKIGEEFMISAQAGKKLSGFFINNLVKFMTIGHPHESMYHTHIDTCYFSP
jgi:hypothetical protein